MCSGGLYCRTDITREISMGNFLVGPILYLIWFPRPGISVPHGPLEGTHLYENTTKTKFSKFHGVL